MLSGDTISGPHCHPCTNWVWVEVGNCYILARDELSSPWKHGRWGSVRHCSVDATTGNVGPIWSAKFARGIPNISPIVDRVRVRVERRKPETIKSVRTEHPLDLLTTVRARRWIGMKRCAQVEGGGLKVDEARTCTTYPSESSV
jgi:hypothetical protein